MLLMTATLVSAEEMAEVRRWAREAADLAGPGDEYMAQRVAGALSALDWVESEQPDRAAVELESVRAKDAEDDMRRRQQRGTYPGARHTTLEWVLGRAEPPF